MLIPELTSVFKFLLPKMLIVEQVIFDIVWEYVQLPFDTLHVLVFWQQFCYGQQLVHLHFPLREVFGKSVALFRVRP